MKMNINPTNSISERGQMGDERRRSFSGEPSFRHRSWSRDTTPVLDLGLPPRVKGSKPYFIQTPPVELKVREGEELTLKCMVDGDPKPVGELLREFIFIYLVCFRIRVKLCLCQSEKVNCVFK